MRRPSLGPDYRRLLLATTVSNLGDGMTVTAAPLLAASLTRDARLVAGLSAAVTLPWLVLGLVSGAVVDRLDRRQVSWIVDACRAAAIACVALLAATDLARIPLLYLLFFALGCGETLADSATSALLPSVVARRDLLRANSTLNTGVIVTNQLAGPPLGGALFALAAAAPFALDAATFGAAAVLVWRIRGDFRPARGDTTTTLRADIAEGMRYLFSQPLLRTLALFLGLWNVVEMAMVSTFVLLAQGRLHIGPVAFGVVMAANAVGGVAAGLWCNRLVGRLGEGRALTTIFFVSAAISFVPALTVSPVLVALSLVGSGFAAVVWNATSMSLRQEIVPDHLLGRVMSAYRLFGMGSMPIGALAGGLLVHSFGLTAPYWVAGSVTLVLAAASLRLLGNNAIAAARSAAPAPA